MFTSEYKFTSAVFENTLWRSVQFFAYIFQDHCTPGEVRMIDCNTCRCQAPGILSCTRRLCPSGQHAPQV